MTALTAARAPLERQGLDTPYGVAAGVKIFAGGLIAFDAAGNARPAANGTVSRCMGAALETADNSQGVDGAISVVARRSCWTFLTPDITPADVGKDCWALDDQTVTKTQPASNPAKAGLILQVTVSGGLTLVWVDTSR